VIGTEYGGDGQTTFALPDFRGRTMIGADNILFALGLELGTDANVLTIANLAAHNHSLDGTSTPEVPLAGALPLFAFGLGALWLVAWRRKKKAALAEASVAGSAKYEAIDL
jgi:microcystin-dependent protein